MMKYLIALRLWIKRQVDKIHNERLRIGLLQALPFWIASLLAGMTAVVYAKLFAGCEELAIAVYKQHSWAFIFLTPLCFILSALVVKYFSPNARGSGIPQVMASIELATVKHQSKIQKLLSFRIIFFKIASSLLMVLGGGAVGREGPTIQIAGSLFYRISQFIPASWPKIARRNMIMTGAAAGLAAAFNTPLGGIVFAVEELTKTHITYFRTALFSAVIIAGLTAQGILGPYLYLGYPPVNGLSTYIFAAVIITAIIAGLSGSIMSKIILRLMAYKSTLKQSRQWILIGCLGLITGLIAFIVNGNILGSGKILMSSLLFTDHKHVLWYLPLVRLAGPILSFTVGGAGGIFAPALSTGACIGAGVSDLFNASGGNANLLMLAGMVGFLTGVTRTPFTAAILVLEMTDRHSIIFYLMLAALIANLASLLIDKHSFYDHLKKQYLKEVLHEDKEDVESDAKDKAISAV
jgi:H+/Cl- antiporter ClcA